MSNITALIKPASYMCNLNCKYCFYCDEVSNRASETASVMEYKTAENLIKKVFEYSGENADVNFMFQGGEPLLAGADFFKFFCCTAEQLKPEGSSINYSLQTNGTLIDDKFTEIFSKYNFLIGVSLDGDEETHNRLRSDSYNDVIAGIEKIKTANVDFNIISVITSFTDPYKLYEFYTENKFTDVQLIYCLNPLDGTYADYSLNADQLARFKKRFFNKWFSGINNGTEMYVREFENLIMFLNTGEYEQCGFLGECTPQLVVEADGTVYPCDFYCLDDFKCSNINDCGLNDIIRCDGIKNFMNLQVEKNKLCNICEVKNYCNGGCKRYRYLYNSVNGYCPQRDFLSHALSKLILYSKEG